MKTTEHVQTEVDAAFLYSRLAEVETDEAIASVFRKMSEIEKSHAVAFITKEEGSFSGTLPSPSWRAKTLDRIGKMFGYDYVLGVLMDTEKGLSKATIAQKVQNKVPLTGSEDNHVKVLRSLLENEAKVSGSAMAKFEGRHRTVGGNALRAAVLGGNDGLVSNFSLVMGVAGATDGQSVLITGLAGTLAGALSMAMGEWISVKSSQELFENQMKLEMEELENNPEGEMKELALIYEAKGIPAEQAKTMAADIMSNKETAHQIMIREELGINHEELEGSAMEAAIYSFVLFTIGAIIPVLPFFFLQGMEAILVSAAVSAVGLFIIGGAITLFTGRSLWFSGSRQVIFGLAAAAVTFTIGKLIGVSVS